METCPDARQTLWQDISRKIQDEWLAVGEDDRSWITGKIDRLVTVQQQLHDLVSVADGEGVCRACNGACCGHGLYHPTLVTILAHLVLKYPLPDPDFKQSCPYLGVTGCRFLPVVRPYNCLTFICELIEDRLSSGQRQSLSVLELELREIYKEFDNRYTGSNMRGLMNRASVDDLQAFLMHKNVLN